MPTILRKVTGETIMGADRKRPAEPIWCYRVVGVVTGFEEGKSTFGEYTELTGDFRVVRFDTGEEFESGSCFLPGGMAENIASRLAQAQKVDPSASIAMVFDIGMAPDNKDRGGPNGEPPTKYTWTIRNPDEKSSKDSPLSKALHALPLPSGVKLLGSNNPQY